MPPLFELMRETNRRDDGRRAPESAAPSTPPSQPQPPAPRSILPRPTGSAPDTRQAERDAAAKLRLSHAPASASASIPTAADRHDHPAEKSSPKGVMLPLPYVFGGIGVLVAAVAIVATLSFNAGARRERSELLPKDDGASPPAVETITDPMSGGNETVRPPRPSDTPSTPKTPPPKTSGPSLPVYGDDPRVEGKNYLIVETMTFDDAMSAAEFLTANGVPSVVVAPEGADPSKLQQQPKGGMWQIIAREGFTRDEYRANSQRADAIERSVKQIGRRWKDDHKGTTNFSRCYWKKFGK